MCENFGNCSGWMNFRNDPKRCWRKPQRQVAQNLVQLLVAPHRRTSVLVGTLAEFLAEALLISTFHASTDMGNVLAVHLGAATVGALVGDETGLVGTLQGDSHDELPFQSVVTNPVSATYTQHIMVDPKTQPVMTVFSKFFKNCSLCRAAGFPVIVTAWRAFLKLSVSEAAHGKKESPLTFGRVTGDFNFSGGK